MELRTVCLVAAFSLGCTGMIDGGLDPEDPRDPRDPGDPMEPLVPGEPVFHFEPEDPSVAPGLRRLTRTEYERTVFDLTGVHPDVSGLPADLEERNLQNDAARLVVRDGAHAQTLLRIATDVASATDIDALLPCASECTDAEIRSYLERVFFEEIDASELAAYVDVRDRAATAGLDAETQRRAIVQVSLISPKLLYRTELGDGSETLTAYELADKLAYFFWGRPPDEMLRAAARDGTLLDASVYAAQIDRLAEDARAHSRLTEFVHDWLGLDHFELSARDASEGLPAELEDSMFAEVDRLIRGVVFEGDGSLRTLMTSDTTYVDARLATLYGIDGVTSDVFEEVSLEGTGRSGLLTTALVLAAHAKESGRSPMQRGKFLVDELLCMGFPESFGAAAMTLPDGVEDLTFREQFAPLEEIPSCSSCHQMLNAGFAFDLYDNIGRRYPLDRVGDEEATGSFTLPPYDPFTFSSPADAAQGFSEHETLTRCFVAQTFRWAQGSVPAIDDAEQMSRLERDFDATDGDVLGLLRDIALSARFSRAVH